MGAEITARIHTCRVVGRNNCRDPIERLECNAKQLKVNIFHCPMTHIETDLGAGEPIAMPHRPKRPNTILYVENQPDTLNLVADILEDAGYRVIAATDREQAHRMLIEHGSEIDIAISDVGYCGGGIMGFIEDLLKHRPDMPLIVTPGVMGMWNEMWNNPSNEDKRTVRIAAVLEKPLYTNPLLKAVLSAFHQSREITLAITPING